MDQLRVTGVDLSPTSTGVSTAVGGLLAAAPVFTVMRSGISVPKTGNVALSVRRINRQIALLGEYVAEQDPDLIVLEGPSLHSRGAFWHENAGLWWNVARAITKSGRPLVVIPPAVLKKFATGSGAAKKSAMCGQAIRRFGLDDIGEDEADALWLAAAGCQYYGWPLVKLPAAQVAELGKVRGWPVLDDDPVAAPAAL